MIRTTSEAPFFGLWRNATVMRELARPERLTTARYEPIVRRLFGGGHIDVLFESAAASCVLGGIRLDPNQLILRERSAFIWPEPLAAVVDHAQLVAIELTLTPWLRSISRARSMAAESIRRFAPSGRFDRARDAGLVGAAPLDLAMPRMAPYIYARRFAKAGHVFIDCSDAALAHAVLADIATVDDCGRDDDAFARAWYGIAPAVAQRSGVPDIVITDQRTTHEADLIVEVQPSASSSAAIVDVPSPVPWDVLFSFDAADAPRVSCFGVHAVEPVLRESVPPGDERAVGGSSGTIVLAVSAEMQTMRGPDIAEVEIYARRLAAEGFDVHVTSEPTDPVLARAQLIHVFGAPFDVHTVVFGGFAFERGIDYVFDLPPKPADLSIFMETTFYLIYRSSPDDAEIRRYVGAYEGRRLESPPDPTGPVEPSPEEYARIEARFIELAQRSVAVLTQADDVDAYRAAFPPALAERISARGVFAEAEPAPARIAHLVPTIPFALLHGPITRRSHSLYPALAAERLGFPIVITGPVWDVDYLQVLRASAPSAIVLADAAPQTISALYRRAAVWLDPARQPRSAAPLLRAVANGALPVLLDESPLVRIGRDEAPTFPLTSIDACARTIHAAMTSAARKEQLDGLRARLLSRRDPATTLRAVMAAYARAPTAV